MQELFFKDANIPDERIHTTTMENWETYDQEIRDAGGIDVMLIGLGWDGHFCSNCPRCTPMDSYTYPMDRKTKNAANPTYPARDHLPITLSMGPKSLMRVKHLVMIVTGKEKAQILKQVLDSPISDELPATVLKLHPKIEDDLKELDNSLQIQVFKKLKQIQNSPEIGLPLGNKNNMNLSGFRKVYVSKKRVRIVYEVQNDVLSIYTIAIGKRDDMEVYKKANERL